MFEAVVLTLFPGLFPGPLGASLLGRALEGGIWSLKTLDFRAFSRDKHRSVDAPPFGGGPGLVMRPDIAAAAIDHARFGFVERGVAPPPVLYLSPRGRPFDQARARRLAAGPGAILVCGRFEGLDHRVLEARAVEEVSLGDVVLMGGEIPAMAVLEATIRLLPGVVGDPASLDEESFADGLLEHPHYTRPAVWEGRAAPAVLLSGDHAKIEAWRRAEAERATRERRPDLWRERRGAGLAADPAASGAGQKTSRPSAASDASAAAPADENGDGR